MIVQTNHQLSKYAAENKVDPVIFLWMGKTLKEKTPPSDFKVITSKNSLLPQQAVQVKESQYLILTYSWTLAPIPNWTCSVVTISPFQCMAPSTWLTNRCADPSMRLYHQLEKDVGCKVLQFINMMKIMKLFGHKTQRCTSTIASSKERWTRVNSISGHNLHEQNFASHSRNLWRPLK